jgi:anthranilate synthase component 1
VVTQAQSFVDAPDLAELRQRLGPELAPALLLSAAAGPQGRFDLLPLTDQPPLVVPYPGHPEHAQRLAALEVQLRELKAGASSASDSLFAGGWLLYLAYEFGAVFERSVPLLAPELDEPLALLWRVPAALVRDRQSQRCELVGLDRALWRQRLAAAMVGEASSVGGKGKGSGASSALREHAGSSPGLQVSEDDPQRFLDGVARIHDYLLAGDVFQVNLSRAWRACADQPVDLDALFARLSAANPAPFAAVLSHDDWGLASSSPERLVSVRGDRVETRPIAGTRRRDVDPVVDARLLAELQRDPKERAEHIMLIDLERNDLGRVCEPGSVAVDELGGIESYAHVHHLVSNVSGRLQDDVSVWSLLRALFPGGTITGCPKVRCMQIIAELEQVGRGAYTGALGYIGDDGSLDFNILIRTISVQHEHLQWRAGAGIVADSIASHELKETRAKALGMLRAMGAAA